MMSRKWRIGEDPEGTRKCLKSDSDTGMREKIKRRDNRDDGGLEKWKESLWGNKVEEGSEAWERELKKGRCGIREREAGRKNKEFEVI